MADGTIVAPTKVCTRCGETKAATPDCFHRNQRTVDGLLNICKPCKCSVMAHRRSHPQMFLRRYRPRVRLPPELTRHCRKCGQEKPATQEFFALKKSARNGLYSICKACDVSRAARYRLATPQNSRSPSRIAAQHRYRAKHPERVRERAREAQTRRRKDGRYRASAAISHRIWRSLKGKGGVSWERIVGYSLRELVIHLELQFLRGMSWRNFGNEWHIDHIRPVSSFTFQSFDDQDFRDCWALANLRPLPKRENLAKSAHRTHLI